MGLILAPNGVLSGTPSIAGTSTTSVCAVDLGGHQKCINGAISIAAAAAADGAFSVAIQAASCNYLRTEYSTRYYEIVASGTASGGIGAEWAVGTNPSFADTTQFTCGSWTATPRLQMCKRGANDPETITWTARFAELWSGTTFYARNGEVDLTARVCKYSDGTGCYTAAYATAKCP